MSLAPPTPVEGLRAPGEGQDAANRVTRPKLKLWDRIKLVILLTVAWFLLVWAAMANNPILPFADAMWEKTRDRSGVFVLVLLGIELLRQAHYLISEHSSRYHWLWVDRGFGGS